MFYGKRRFLQLCSCILLVALFFTGCGDSATAEKEGGAVPASASVMGAYQGNLKVRYIDVGQGDSSLIELPNGQTMLIDAGEAEYAEDVIDYIESKGYSSLDYVIATHPHSDHIGGLPAVIDHFSVNAVYMPKVQNNTQIFANLLTSVKNKGLKVQTAKAGVNLLKEDDLSVDIVAPVGDSYSDLNNYSAVIKVQYGETSFLFMGDAEKKSENEITAAIDCDVLKAGHHGSDYSTSDEFLQRVTPEYAVISCGTGNQYGHPDAEIIDRLDSVSAEILRTDELGTITIESNGAAITVDKKASLQKENAPPPAAAAPIPITPQPQNNVVPPVADPAAPASPEVQATEQMVYVTETGSKYHMDGCQYLKQSNISISLSQARQSYEPCSKCGPPQ